MGFTLILSRHSEEALGNGGLIQKRTSEVSSGVAINGALNMPGCRSISRLLQDFKDFKLLVCTCVYRIQSICKRHAWKLESSGHYHSKQNLRPVKNTDSEKLADSP